MQHLSHIQPENPIEDEILKDFIDYQEYASGESDPESYKLSNLRDDIGDDDNAGGYNYTPEQFDAFCLKYNINPETL